METITIILIVWLVVALLLMHDVARSARCRWCDHCRLEIVKEQEQRKKNGHIAFHMSTGGNAQTCNDPRCEGRR